ncbi:AP2-like ethylene-responsive transcription factor AIL1 [Hondaea fermentalgiana]|uniref:AP2-like ethylene-responsive transcription factor AIL1 n=1 Tax=Hondaea fermentalgiana TaxID=2315210 RepID=A0A2R5GZH7_9STRA|nr:AP2-like ethylene-responsive transcription factor AIL1 [Hondaea fermentalgiana]|eukprot:GBG33881.1 AP2-like ethylene-responsive transcription factor AIL1 [Hondaea fermentalgiana]
MSSSGNPHALQQGQLHSQPAHSSASASDIFKSIPAFQNLLSNNAVQASDAKSTASSNNNNEQSPSSAWTQQVGNSLFVSPQQQQQQQQQPMLFFPQMQAQNGQPGFMYMNFPGMSGQQNQTPPNSSMPSFTSLQQYNGNVFPNNNNNNNNNNVYTDANSRRSSTSNSQEGGASSAELRAKLQALAQSKKKRKDSPERNSSDVDESNDSESQHSSEEGRSRSISVTKKQRRDERTDSGKFSEGSTSGGGSDYTESHSSNNSVADSSAKALSSAEDAAHKASEAAQKAQLQARHLQQRRRRRRARRNRAPDCPHSDYRGVSWHRRDRKWLARTWINGRIEHLGCYRTEEMAALAVDIRTVEHFGPDTKKELNFPDPDERAKMRSEFEATGEFKIKTARELNGPGNYSNSRFPGAMPGFTTVILPGYGPVAISTGTPGNAQSYGYQMPMLYGNSVPQMQMQMQQPAFQTTYNYNNSGNYNPGATGTIAGNGLNPFNLAMGTSAKRRKRTQPSAASMPIPSRFRGVSWHRRDKVWLARVWIDSKIRHLGCYKLEEMAALAVDLRHIAMYGETGRALNFPDREKREKLISRLRQRSDFKLDEALEQANARMSLTQLAPTANAGETTLKPEQKSSSFAHKE